MNAEIAIVGGGLVGAGLAAALAGSGVSVTVIDPRGATAVPATGFDPRVYALRPASVTFLERCAIWGRVDSTRVCPVLEMRVSGDDGRSVLTFDAYRAGLAQLAVIAEDANLQRAARATLDTLPLVSVITGRSVVAAQWAQEQVSLTLDDGTTVGAALAVAADGADSRLRTLAGIEVDVRDYGQRAVVANFRAARPHRQTAFQWFRNDGVLALLPLPDDQVSLVWSTPEPNAERLTALPPAEFARSVAAAAFGALGDLEVCSAVASFPLRLMRARRVVAPRLVMVGDAAHNVHPLAGQGLNLGLADCETLARLIAARPPVESVASPGLLARYRRSRAEEVFAMQALTDGLRRLFEAKVPGLKWLRNTGLRLVDRLAPVKRELIRRAAGGVF
jgi:2-octaprenylphenol hydroxylase